MSAGGDFQPWFEKYPHLLREQTEILNSAGFELDNGALSQERRIQFVGQSKVEPGRQLVVVFPAAFPSSAPQIFDSPTSKLLTRHHRIDTRQLCLFSFDENRWSATRSVADALAEAEELISKFKEANAASENQPPEPITRAIQYVPEAAVLVPPPISTFTGFAGLKFPTGNFSLKFFQEGNQKLETRGRGVVYEANFGGEKLRCPRTFSDCLGTGGKDIHGDWFYLAIPPTQESLGAVLSKCFQQAKGTKRADYYWLGLIFNEEAGTRGQSRLTWLTVRAKADGQFHLVRTFPYIQRDRFARIPGLEGIGEKRVTIIGCGSLGSKIASNLAASGVNRFHLVDYDYFEPNNSVRHELGFECFGLNKEKALMQRLCSLNPAVAENSTAFNFQATAVNSLAGEQHFHNLIRESDLIVDATAKHSVSHFLNELSSELRIPVLFASVTNGAWGGEVVRVVPGKTPCWLCWQDQYFDNKPPSAPESSAEVFAPGCDQPTFTGTTYDLGIVAGLATFMAVGTLLPSGEFSDFSKNYIRWSGKDKDGQPAFLTETLPTNTQRGCWLCGS